MLTKIQDARIAFCATFQTYLEAPHLQWPAWLRDLRSRRKIYAATKEAGLPKDFGQDIAIIAFTLNFFLRRAPPPTNKEIVRTVTQIENALRRERAALEPRHMPYDIECHLMEDYRSIELESGDILGWHDDTPIDDIRQSLDLLIERVGRIRLPPAAQPGPKISPVTVAIWLLVRLARARKPDIGSRALTKLVRAVLEPAVNNAVGPDGACVDWPGQVVRALRELGDT